MISDIFNSHPSEIRTPIEEKVYTFLAELGISFEGIDHNAADTISACKEIEKYIGGKICKNLFLKNSAKTQYYLLLMDGDKKFVSSEVSKKIGSTRLSFADEIDMMKMLSVTPGSVSILALINDINRNVKLLIDSDLLKDEFFCCHPCKNTTTLRFKTTDISSKFLPATGHEFMIIDI